MGNAPVPEPRSSPAHGAATRRRFVAAASSRARNHGLPSPRPSGYPATVDILTSPEAWVSLLTLTAMEIVLGIDNVVFISILTGRLPLAEQPLARRLGLSLALVMRLGLLFAISWVMGLTEPLFTVFAKPVSGRDLILLGGGLFLVAKATHEIYDKLEVAHQDRARAGAAASFGVILAQIVALDIVFSL